MFVYCLDTVVISRYDNLQKTELYFIVATQNNKVLNGLNIYFVLTCNMVSKKLNKYIWFGL